MELHTWSLWEETWTSKNWIRKCKWADGHTQFQVRLDIDKETNIYLSYIFVIITLVSLYWFQIHLWLNLDFQYLQTCESAPWLRPQFRQQGLWEQALLLEVGETGGFAVECPLEQKAILWWFASECGLAQMGHKVVLNGQTQASEQWPNCQHQLCWTRLICFLTGVITRHYLPYMKDLPVMFFSERLLQEPWMSNHIVSESKVHKFHERQEGWPS